MTIDEAIMAHKKEADECRNLILKEKQLEPQESYYCLCLEKNAKEHEQLAEWLEELKAYKEKEFDVLKQDGQLLYKNGVIDGYNKAIDDFVEEIKTYLSMSDMNRKMIKQIAEKLKGSGFNE